MPGPGCLDKGELTTRIPVHLLQGIGISEDASGDRKEGDEEKYDQPLSECFKKLIENNII